jgi:hypothetical protein
MKRDTQPVDAAPAARRGGSGKPSERERRRDTISRSREVLDEHEA